MGKLLSINHDQVTDSAMEQAVSKRFSVSQSAIARLWLLLAALVLFWMPETAHAQLSFELRTGDDATSFQKLTVDSNKCPNEGPVAAYVGGKVTNTTGSEITNINATLTGLSANVYLAGGQPGTLYIGTLGAGETANVYWFLGTSCNIGSTTNASVQMTSDSGTQTRALSLQVIGAISANAGGNLLGGTLGPGAVAGQRISLDVQYDFGGTDTGDEYYLQPSGSQAFDANCFRLDGSEIIGSNLNAAPVGTLDDMYFVQPNKQPGNNYNITIRYFFTYQCAGVTTVARPYAQQTSGTKIKYTGNYDGSGSIQVGFPAGQNPFTISKTVSEDANFVGAPGDLTYTITITNPSIHTSRISQIVDVLPGDMEFVALTASSDIQAANSSSIPSAGDTGTLTFIGRGSSYQIAGGSSVTLQYTASRPSTTGTFLNSAQAYFGQATTAVVQASYEQVAITPLSVTKVSSLVSDPVTGTADPFHLPGAVMDYLIVVGNPNPAAIDPDTIFVTDIVPPETKFCLADLDGAGSGPVKFNDGATTSTLSYGFATLEDDNDNLDFSDDGGVTWDHDPIPDGDNCDPSITHFRINPQGSFAANASFSIEARFIIE